MYATVVFLQFEISKTVFGGTSVFQKNFLTEKEETMTCKFLKRKNCIVK